MARGGDKKDEGPTRRPRRAEPERKPEHAEPEKEQNLPEQDVYGNSFLVGAMNGDRTVGGPPADGGVDQDVLQDFGGVEDGDPAPRRPVTDDDSWFRPRFRRKGGEEIEPEGPAPPEEPGIPPEDADWVDALEPEGEPWRDPAPQASPTTLEDQLDPWLRALFPLAGPLPSQNAIARAMAPVAALQDPTGDPLLGTAAAATLGAAVAAMAGESPEGRLRLQRGLALVSAPYVPREASRTALQLARLEGTGQPPEAQPDPWLGRLVVARLGLEAPPTPELDDPPEPEPDADDALDYGALIREELGAAPDPSQALRGAALEACESQARWAVALRAGSASCARALLANGVAPELLVAVLARCDELVGQSIALLKEIAAAARTTRVPIRGLRNGLARSARLLTTAHRNVAQGLASSGFVPDAFGERPAPSDPDLELALRDGRPLPPPEEPLHPDYADLVTGLDALARKDWKTAIDRGRALAERAEARRDGIGVATGALLEVCALQRRGDSEAADALRREVGGRLLGRGARSGVSLLARWVPAEEPEPDADQAPAG